MKRFFVFAVAAVMLAGCKAENEVDLHEVAVKVSENGLARTDLGHYMGTCLYHGMADLALASGEKADMDRVMDILNKIATGEIQIHYNAFIDYEIGGQAAAMLAYKGQKSLEEEVRACAAKMWEQQPRTTDGVITSQSQVVNDCFWIDIAFTVTPFFLYAGLLENNQEYVDYSAWMALKMCQVLYDPDSGLYHQARNHPHCPGISQDCWSRGNGWMSMALGALLKDYPEDGKYRNDIVKEAERFYPNVCRYQDENGMWHQELTDLSSYVETSGSAQITAGLGAAIQAGVISREGYMPYFEKGIRGLLSWVDPDGSTGHCCRPNLVPGQGRKEDYKAVHWFYNETHIAGPVVLALAQALALGIDKVVLDAPMGSANDADRPRAYARIIDEFKDHLAWENDRIAVRVYSQKSSTEKPLSGIDFWAKTVDYPIIDQWYGKLAAGESYHIDTGTGCDWYDMGAGRGVGGTGVWDGENLYCAVPYETAEIASNGPERADFILNYSPYQAGDEIVTESKRVEMICGTSFFKVTETVTTASGNPVILAIGVQDFGNAEVLCNEGGKLFIAETIKSEEPFGLGADAGTARYQGVAGTAVVVNPAQAAGTAVSGQDILQLVKVESGEEFVYFAGATWEFQRNSGRWNGGRNFWIMTSEESSWDELNKVYE